MERIDPSDERPSPAVEPARIELDYACSACDYRIVGWGTATASFCCGCGARIEPAHGRPVVAEMPPAQASVPPSEPGRKRVIVVEDSTMLRRAVVRVVRQLGYEAVEAANGAEAMAAMAATAPDWVVTDYHMPEMNGIELVERMRAEERLRHVPVIMLARNTRSAIIRKARSLRVVDYIHKDAYVDPADLLVRLRRHLAPAV